MERSRTSALCCALVASLFVLALCASARADTGAAKLVERAGLRRGVCAGVGLTPELAIELTRSAEMLLHIRDPRPDVVAELRRRAEADGLDIRRLAVEQHELRSLPYADNMLDVVFALDSDAIRVAPLADEILRVLRPNGRAFISIAKQQRRNQLIEWADDKNLGATASFNPKGAPSWIEFEKPEPEGTDDWSHWEHGPDNNPVSADQLIKAPYMTQYMAMPQYIPMPAITTIAGGRTFLAIGHIAHHEREWPYLNTLIARNGYNGTILWERKLPEGYLVHRSAFIAQDEQFYMIGDDGCLVLDPATGAERSRIRIPGIAGQWKWMAMKDDVLYVLIGKKERGPKTTRGRRESGGWSWDDLSEGYYAKRVPYGFGHTIVAYDVAKREVLWRHSEKGKPIDSRAMAVGDKRVYLYCPDQHLRAIRADNGEVVWTTGEKEVLGLIEKPGKGLTSTPGFRTLCIAVLTPDALIIQGQTRAKVIGLSTSDGSLLWSKDKVTNNPNAIYVDGKVVLGVGENGSHVVIDPVSGSVEEDLKFRKVSCTRLTACSDSFFVRGEGTLRFDRESKRLLVDGAMRPACNDGALPANGLLYVGPWGCDCNLSLTGNIAKCSAGNFRFDRVATEVERLERSETEVTTPLEVSPKDWSTDRGGNDRSAGTAVSVGKASRQLWAFQSDAEFPPTAPTAAGGLVFFGSEDGHVRALNAKDGSLKWTFATSAPVKAPPTISEGRAFFGGGDGFVYALEAATGRLLWRFRAAPIDRHIMIYGTMSSTWPVHTGVTVHQGTVYFAAGIIDYDGTYVYGLDAATGAIKWQNNATGHLSAELRKGVSAQGTMSVQGGRLLLAGGNQASPAPFDIETGRYLADAPNRQGKPIANAGRLIGVFREAVITGGRILHVPPENIASKAFFDVEGKSSGRYRIARGGIAPAWDDKRFVFVGFKSSPIVCCDAAKTAELINRDPGEEGNRVRELMSALVAHDAIQWKSRINENEPVFETVSLALTPEAVIVVFKQQVRGRAWPERFVAGLSVEDGSQLFRHHLPSAPLPGGLAIDDAGRIIVTLMNGSAVCFGR